MSTVIQIIVSSTGRRQLRLLDALVPESARANTDIDLDPIREHAATLQLDPSAINSDLAQMKNRGWVDYFASLAGIGSAIIKQPGIDAAKDYRALLRNKVMRNRACRNEFLHWLYEGDDTPEPFLQVHAFYDQPFTEQEIINAQIWLKDEGFISGVAAADGEIYGIQITSKGTRAVESGQPVTEWADKIGRATVNDHRVTINGSQNVNVAQNSQNVNQSNALSSEQISHVNDVVTSYRALREHLGFPEEQGEEADVIIGQLETDLADPKAGPGKIRQSVDRLGEIVRKHGSKAIGLGLLQLIDLALQNLA